ncbi:sulfite exporter TauE/SafE family protein [bacterium]|nr:sulfite exporter TauE/SafE family protein [bacterium]
MIFQLTLETGILIACLALLCEYIDSTLGMGYGTILTPVLLIAGYEPLQVVPAVLVSELVTGLLAAFLHHKTGNVNLGVNGNVRDMVAKLRALGYVETFKQTFPIHLKTALALGFCSVLGTLAAVFVAISLPKFWVKMYIGVMILIIGIVILITINKKYTFSWKKIFSLGTLAAFNKGLSGGGYGPVITGGQIISGIEAKSAIGITSFAEGLTCLVGVIAYALTSQSISWALVPYLLIGGVISVPISVFTVKRMKARNLTRIIGIVVIILGLNTLLQTIL